MLCLNVINYIVFKFFIKVVISRVSCNKLSRLRCAYMSKYTCLIRSNIFVIIRNLRAVLFYGSLYIFKERKLWMLKRKFADLLTEMTLHVFKQPLLLFKIPNTDMDINSVLQTAMHVFLRTGYFF
ncbi:unnamed protein product [Chrysodeixis includens]|uniref:Uncharacterized protein n=1 Tax=Chrysodeixis includens TaxID=689277 RepID=A0A9N8L0S3_CHRIL|nr:unnamed protein product [Chrysodeixis includens]